MNDKIGILDDSFQTTKSYLQKSSSSSNIIPMQQHNSSNNKLQSTQIRNHYQNDSTAHVEDETLYNGNYLRTILLDDISHGGELNMDNNQNDYVTHRELDEKFGRISDQIDSSEKYLKEHIERKSAETNGKIDVLTQSINDFKQSFPQTVNLAVRDEFDKRDKERKETNRFIIGTLVIGGISLIVSIVSVIVSIFIH